VDTVTGVPTKFAGVPPGTHALQLPDDSFNASHYFLTVFGRPDNASACECERVSDGSLAQRLHLLNAKAIQEKLSSPSGIAAQFAKETAPPSEKLRSLYLTAFSREPRAEELAHGLDFLSRRSDRDAQAWEDVVWAVINTKEFLFNH
jgi:hypothetical protein